MQQTTQRIAGRNYDSSAVLLAAERLLDTLTARPRTIKEFEDAKAHAVRSARVALDQPPARCHATRGWLGVAKQLNRALRSETNDRNCGLHLTAALIANPRCCQRAACRKAQTCRGAPRACLTRSASRAPGSLQHALKALTARIARGDTPELAVALLPFECKVTLWAWQRT